MTLRLRGWIGLVGLVPALTILLGGLLHSGFGYSTLGDAIADPDGSGWPFLFGVIGTPPVVVAGMIGALILNLGPTVKMVRGHRARREATWLNPAVVLLSALSIVLITGYLAIENLPVR